MNWLLIVVLIIFAFFAIRGWWKGLLRLLFSLVSVIVLIAVMAYATPHVNGFIREHTVIYTAIEDKCTETFQEKMESGIEGALENDSDSSSVAGVALPERAVSYIIESGEDAIEDTGVYEKMGSRAADLVLSGISFFVTLILAIILLKIIDHVLGIANHIPVIKGINRALGFFGGILEAFIIVSLVFMFIALIAGTDAGGFVIGNIDESAFLSYLYYHNPMLGIFSNH